MIQRRSEAWITHREYMKRYIYFLLIFLATFAVNGLTSKYIYHEVYVAASAIFGMGIALFWLIETKK